VYRKIYVGCVELKLITLYLPEQYIKALDDLVVQKMFPNRAEAIRMAVRDLLTEEWNRVLERNKE